MRVSKIVAISGVLLAFVIGLGAAYVRNSLGSVSASGLLYVGPRKQDAFGQTFDKLAHLGTIEYAAANCSRTSDVQLAISNERKMLALLAEENKPTNGESLPLAAAQARLTARELINAETQSGKDGYSALVEQAKSRAVEAGWKDPSEAHLRQIVEALDRDTCTPPEGGTTSR
jgi:hypothetical protein